MFNNNNTGTGMFPSNNTGTSIFGNNTAGTGNPGLSRTDAQQQQQKSLFSTTNTPAFGNNTGNTFSNNNNNSAPMFGNANQGNTMFNNTNTGGTMFGNTNTGGGLFNTSNTTGPMLGNPNTGNTGGALFNTNTGGNTGTMFNTGGTMFNNTGNNAGQPNNTGLNFGNRGPQGNFPTIASTNSYYANDSLAFQNSLATIKLSLEQCMNRISSRNLEGIRLESWNIFRDKQLNQTTPLKNEVLCILMGFHELERTLKKLKESNIQIQNKMSSFSKDCHKKLALYKKCLLQTVSHTKLIEQVSSELDLMGREMQQYFKPLYNAYKSKKKISVKDPNEFDLKVSYDVLNKLQILNQRVDDMLACESSSEEDMENTITVFEQLIQYYQNVSCSFKDFSHRYNNLKRTAIEKERAGSYEGVMSKVAGKVQENLKKQFKYYDLIKEIDDLLTEKQKREEKKKLESKSKFTSYSSKRTYF